MTRWQRFTWWARRGLLLAFTALILHQDMAPLQGFDARLEALLRGQRFDFITWALQSIASKSWESALGAQAYLTEAQRKQFVLDYLDLIGRINDLNAQIEAIYADPQEHRPEATSAALRRELAELQADKQRRQPLVESILQEQLAAVLADEGLGWGGLVFPPVALRFTPLPMQLVISPREAITLKAQASLNSDLPVERQVALENQIDRELHVSSLVVPLGGLAMYPAMLLENASLEWTLKGAAHEWTHHWLLFRPLGWNYESSPETRTINETVANIAGNELGEAVLARFYPEFAPPPAPSPSSGEGTPERASPPAFDFRAEMHLTRVTVDQLLAEGKIAEAEAYMEQRRELFVRNGYRIRKLNQAYFAFYGAYADRPGERGEDPIGPAVVRLRQQSASLREFLETVSGVTTLAELQRLTAPAASGN